jgi:hypothetical protein
VLNCVYHPIDEMRVVDNSEREQLIETGYWFDNPDEAKAYKDKLQNEIKEEKKVKKPKIKEQ